MRASTILGVEHAAPDFAVPTGACDCHTHVFGPAAKYPLAANRTYKPGDASIEDMLALHRALGINRVVIVHPSPYGSDNACTVDAVRQIGANARGVAVIDAATTDEELRIMHAAGIRGVRANLETHGIHDPKAAGELLEWTAKRVAHLGWHVQTYTNLNVIVGALDSIRRMVTPLVVDHIGRAQAKLGVHQNGMAQLLELVASGKAYVKLSAPHRISDQPDCADAAPIVRALIEANPERMLWGTDWPHPGGTPGVDRDPQRIEPFNPIDDGRALNRFANWVADAGRLRQILVDNPERLYGF